MMYVLIISLIVLSLSLFLVLDLSIQWKFMSRKQLYTTSNISYPIIGCLISFYKNRRRLLDWYTDLLSASPTQTIVISRLGARRTIITANPQNVEYMLKTNFSNFPKGKPFTEILGDFLGNGIFNVDGDMWQNQRKMVIHELINPKFLRDYYIENVLKQEVDKKLLPVLQGFAEEAVDLQDLLRNHAFDLVCKVSLGYDPCSLEYYRCSNTSHPIIEAFDVASLVCARRGLSATWKLKRLFNMGSENKLKQAISKIHSFIEDIIRERKRAIILNNYDHEEEEEEEEEGLIKSSTTLLDHDLLSKMLLDGKYDDEFVRDTMISLIMAGRDTTSAAMTWLFYLLSCHPNIEDEVVRELRLVQDNIEISMTKYESLNELKLLKACICESMRLFPPVAWDSKHAISNDMMPDGTPVRAGDRVTYFPYGMGRMESLWGEDRFEFKPERWIINKNNSGSDDDVLLTNNKNVSPYKFPVFQAGPRVCLGKEMAFIQIKYVVAAILDRFKIRPAATSSDHPPVFVPLLTAHMAGGFKVFVTPRR